MCIYEQIGMVGYCSRVPLHIFINCSSIKFTLRLHRETKCYYTSSSLSICLPLRKLVTSAKLYRGPQSSIIEEALPKHQRVPQPSLVMEECLFKGNL